MRVTWVLMVVVVVVRGGAHEVIAVGPVLIVLKIIHVGNLYRVKTGPNVERVQIILGGSIDPNRSRNVEICGVGQG